MASVDLLRLAAGLLAFVSLIGVHGIGDHWIQTSAQACKKALDKEPMFVALRHCAGHVASYTAAGAIAFLTLALWFGVPLSPGWVVAGLTFNAITHFIADLRTPLRWIADRTGLGGYVRHAQVRRGGGVVEDTGPGTALFHLDQSWHIFWLLISAAIIAGP